ncbi:MAG: flagellar basal body L-ring protein FlgH [Cyanobacteria bacterium NC_groundwater_1444_Ag_S-0.65um_54_12]|nr:flagellar basal body L-ring protein FlgH [Cyanobacteria bacterium NC_groundwater_1444_Ag_S-0.65um_54_12]
MHGSRYRWLIGSGMLIGSVLPLAPARADSLFADTHSSGLISDQIGDRRSSLGPGALITVVVTENIQAEQNATTKAVKDSKLTASWDFGSILPRTFKSGIDLRGKEDFSGDGVTRRGGTINMQVAAQVVEILPDGSLRIKGTKELVVNEEKSTVVLSGIVRPYDIGENNKVSSDKIANFQLEYQGSGPNSAKTTPGLLTRVLNWLF